MRGLLVIALVCAAVAPARADDRPWASGVTDADQAAALDEFRAGNELFAQGKLAPAAAHYRTALARWDHPSIEFNLAVCLIRSDDPVGAYAHLEASLRFGAAPFERPELYQQALDYQKLLEGQLSRLTIACTLDGAQVTLDGAPLLTAPGSAQRVLKPGAHEVVATRDGYATTVRDLMLMPGAATEEDVTPIPASEATTLVRRWTPWKPWAIAGAGAAMLLVGGALELQATSELDDFDSQIAALCATSCARSDVPQAVLDLETAGKRDNVLGIASLAIGVATSAVGVWMVIRNQPHAVALDVRPPPSGTGAVLGLVGRF